MNQFLTFRDDDMLKNKYGKGLRILVKKVFTKSSTITLSILKIDIKIKVKDKIKYLNVVLLARKENNKKIRKKKGKVILMPIGSK